MFSVPFKISKRKKFCYVGVSKTVKYLGNSNRFLNSVHTTPDLK